MPGPLAGWLSNDELLVLAGGTSAAADGAGSPITPPASTCAATRDGHRASSTHGRPADQLRGFSVSPDGAWAEGPVRTAPACCLASRPRPMAQARESPIPSLDCPTQWGPNGPVYTVTPDRRGGRHLASWTDQYSPMVTIDLPSARPASSSPAGAGCGAAVEPPGTTGGWLVFQWRWVMAALLAGTLVTWVVLRGRSGSVAGATGAGAGEAQAEWPGWGQPPDGCRGLGSASTISIWE